MTANNTPQTLTAAELNAKLKQEEARHESITAAVTRSGQLRDGMFSILDSFEQRLAELESTVLPLYEHTARLQRKQNNINMVLKEIDATLGFYNVAHEMDVSLKVSDPSRDLEKYLKQMDQLKAAMRFFGGSKSGEIQKESAMSSFELGCDALCREFREVLLRSSQKTNPEHLVDLFDSRYNPLADRRKLLPMPKMEAVSRLSQIATWLALNADATDALQHYASIRATVITHSIQAALEIRPAVPFVAMNKAVASPRLDKRQFKAHTLLRKVTRGSAARLGSTSSGGALNASDPSDHSSSFGADAHAPAGANGVNDAAHAAVFATAALVALFESECYLISQVFGEARLVSQVRTAVIKQPLQLLISLSETCVNAVQSATALHHFAGVALALLPMCTYYLQNATKVDALTQTAGGDVRQRVAEQRSMIDAALLRSLEDFIESVKVDADRFVPADGTVHQVTSNTMSFMKHVCEYRDTLATLLAGGRQEAARVAFPKLLARILSSLGLNLCNKAELYGENGTLKALFLLNNYNHILKSLMRGDVIKIVCEQNRDVQSYYEERVTLNRRLFVEAWYPLRNAFEPLLASKIDVRSLDDKGKDAIKNVFASFNSELERVCCADADYTVPDLELAAAVQTDIKLLVVQPYGAFFQMYHNAPFTKHPEKYVKHRPEHVADAIQRLFDVAA